MLCGKQSNYTLKQSNKKFKQSMVNKATRSSNNVWYDKESKNENIFYLVESHYSESAE